MSRTTLQLLLFLNQFEIRSAQKKNTLGRNGEIMVLSFFNISRYATAGPGCRRKNLVIGFVPLHFKNASAIADEQY